VDYDTDDPISRKAWADQAGARIRDVAKELVRAARIANVPAVAADFQLHREGHVRVVYSLLDDELYLVFPNTDRETVLLNMERLGIRR